jgi:predicted transcriptional regulator
VEDQLGRKKSPTLTAAEHRIMEVLWSKGSATVADVTAAVGEPALAYTTVLTTLRTLERKGYARHRVSGRAFIYLPAVDRDAVRRGVVGYVLREFFDDSPRTLMLNLLESERIDRDELARLRSMIDAAAREERRPG